MFLSEQGKQYKAEPENQCRSNSGCRTLHNVIDVALSDILNTLSYPIISLQELSARQRETCLLYEGGYQGTTMCSLIWSSGTVSCSGHHKLLHILLLKTRESYSSPALQSRSANPSVCKDRLCGQPSEQNPFSLFPVSVTLSASGGLCLLLLHMTLWVCNLTFSSWFQISPPFPEKDSYIGAVTHLALFHLQILGYIFKNIFL